MVNPRSFRARLFCLLLLVLVPGGFILILSNLDRQRSEKDRVREQAVSVAKLAATSQAYYVKQTRQLLATMTQFQFLVLATNLSFCQTGMINLRLISPDFSDFGLIERDGTVFCHSLGTNQAGGDIGLAFTKRVLAKPAFSMSGLHLDRNGEKPLLDFIYPVFSSGTNLARLMYASLKLPLLSSALTEISLPEGGVVSVLDELGNVLAQHPEPEKWVGKNVSSQPFVKLALAKKEGLFETNGTDGAKYIYALSTVSDGSKPVIFIQVAFPQKVFFADADAHFGAALMGIILIATVVLFLAKWFSERAFINPVRAILEAAERLTNGDLLARTGISNGTSELNLLARQFDVMAEKLAHRQNQLELANKEITKVNTELEQRVNERTTELRTLNGELEAFSYSVSHDLRAPLRHMDGFAHLLAEDAQLTGNPTAQRYLGLITKSAKQMGVLIDDLLSFSKMSRQSIAMQTVQMSAIVSGLVEEAKSAEAGREIIWTVGSLPEVQGDEAMLRQVWQNLISNAVKYTRGKQPALIEIFAYAEKQETIFIVSDNGAGFDMQYAQRLFGVFQRLHRQDEFEGTGIGLANVRRIVQRHKGRTWAEGKPGQGAKFYFSLPI